MHKWKKMVAGIVSASMLVPTTPLSLGAAEVISWTSDAETTEALLVKASEGTVPEGNEIPTTLELSITPEPSTYPDSEPSEIPNQEPDEIPLPEPSETPTPEPSVTPMPKPGETPTPSPSVPPTTTPNPASTEETSQPTEGEELPDAEEVSETQQTNEELIGKQQIIIPPQIEEDFRLTTVEKVYGFAKKETKILEEKQEDARVTGILPANGVCYILQEEENGWIYVESGNVRGFLQKQQIYKGKWAEWICKRSEKAAKGKKPKYETAVKKMDPLENKNLLYTKTTVKKTVVEKTYAICLGSKVHIREEKNKKSRIVGTLKKGQICYLLADKKKDWVYVESGDVRGFIKSKYLLMGEEAEEKIRAYEDAGQDPETCCGLANLLIDPQENKACYYTFTSVKEVSPEYQTRQALLTYAEQFLGNPYVWGGTDPVSGADCSGFVQHVYAQFGIQLPRTSVEQSQYGMKIPVADAAPGDLIFYAKDGQIYHVVVYIGDGRTVHYCEQIADRNIYLKIA